jgi:hypothetical protein
MNRIWEQRDNSSFPLEEGRLERERETTYKRATEPDDPATKTAGNEDPAVYYKILQIDPHASLAEIQYAFEKLHDAWDPERYSHVDSWKEKSLIKRNEIKYAYEKLLVLHLQRDGMARVDASDDSSSSSPPPAATPDNTPPEIPAPAVNSSARDERPGLAGSLFGRFPGSSPWLIGTGVTILALAVMVFFRPGFYHYTSIRLGSQDYPLRINRLTARTDYYDGTQWRRPPMHSEAKNPVSAPVTVATPPVPPNISSPTTTPPPAVAPPSATSAPTPPVRHTPAAPQAAIPAAPITAQLPATKSLPARPLQIKPNPVPSPGTKASPESDTGREIKITRHAAATVPAGKSAPKTPAMKTSPVGHGPFHIQISAHKEKEKAEAVARKLRAEKLVVEVETVTVEGKGVWHRVLVGGFADRDTALNCIRTYKLDKTYPGSFVQKSHGK